MSQVIAGIYEIQQQVGAGGGGIVYLGRHLRLEKQVILKADKRTLSTRSEILRREVDLLKGLSHTYIPQVYDFVQENGVVYTVMDFIEGESLDKLLLRGERPSQPDVVRWACQLLEALCYLHSRPPHGILHGDIKPANIMLRPNGDICLIDYNIALALGEDGAVKVGFSRGYASPEHYGIDYAGGQNSTRSGRKSRAERATEADSETVTMSGTDTETMEKPSESTIPMENSGTSTGGNRSVMLDVRSDIYSLGATLYHLLSGARPESDAYAVEPLNGDICSPAVSNILKKAMAPDPDLRYQSAEEMLRAFRSLYRTDQRARRHRRHLWFSTVFLSVLFLAGGGCTFTGLKQMEQKKSALALAEYSADDLEKGDISGAVRLALQAIPEGKSILDAPVTAEARKALTDALGVYDLADGFQALDRVSLPAAPFELVTSPDGKRFAVVYQSEVSVFRTEKGEREVSLPVQDSALSEALFLGNDRILYAGDKGISLYDLKAQKVLWTGGLATTLSVSGDGSIAAAVNRDEGKAVIYQVEDGRKVFECSFSNRHLSIVANDIFANMKDDIFTLNDDGTMLAVSFSDGGLQIFDLQNPENDLIVYDESEYQHFEGGFCGKYFAFAANKSDTSQFGLIDLDEAVYVGGYDSRDPFLLQTRQEGIYLAQGNLLVRFSPDTLKEMELAYTDQSKIISFSVEKDYVMVATEDCGLSFYDSGAHRISAEVCQEPCDFVSLSSETAVAGNRSEASVRMLKLRSYEDSQLLSYDARYVHDEARISQNQKTAMLFGYHNFRIYDMDGRLITEEKLSDAEHIYDQQFEKSEAGSWLKVIWYDGMVRRYDASDGSLLDEQQGEPPAENLYEEFFTDQYRFASPLHGTPEVYDKKTGKLAGTLEKDSYLTYVTQVGDYIITEYISAAGERYGLLLDGQLQTLARLPKLCDIVDGKLVFDYETGNLRQCRLYSLQELIALGEKYRSNTNEDYSE